MKSIDNNSKQRDIIQNENTKTRKGHPNYPKPPIRKVPNPIKRNTQSKSYHSFINKKPVKNVNTGSNKNIFNKRNTHKKMNSDNSNKKSSQQPKQRITNEFKNKIEFNMINSLSKNRFPKRKFRTKKSVSYIGPPKRVPPKAKGYLKRVPPKK